MLVDPAPTNMKQLLTKQITVLTECSQPRFLCALDTGVQWHIPDRSLFLSG